MSTLYKHKDHPKHLHIHQGNNHQIESLVQPNFLGWAFFKDRIRLPRLQCGRGLKEVKLSKSLNGTSSLNEGDMTTAMRGISFSNITLSAMFILALLQVYYVFAWWFGNIWNPLAACTVPIIGKEHERTMQQIALCSHLQEGLHAACLKVQCSSVILHFF